MTKKQSVEVLAPGGSYESITAAVAAGADAVYTGGARFGARAYANNLDQEQLCRAIDYVHLHGRKLYLTVNTLFKEQELDELYDYLAPFYECGLDSVLVQDLGVLSFIRENFPDLPVHASTQMTVTGPYGAKLLKEMGVSRVVTARELSLEEIRQIHQETGMEIETFVHGALCYCYSGQCLMSSLIGGRSGNRGRCAQPCRLPYEVRRGNRLENGRNERYVLSLKDLCALDLIPDIIEAGVYSLKIEGRMKSPRYTAGVTAMYRKYVDRYLRNGRKDYQVSPGDRKIISDLYDRGGFTEGYYHEHNGRDMVVLKEKPAFKESNSMLFSYLDQTYVESPLRKPASGQARIHAGQPAKFCLEAEGEGDRRVTVEVEGPVVEEAQKQPMTSEKICRQLGKTGNTPFFFEELSAQVDGQVFLLVQNLNELRRKGLEELEKALLSPYRRERKARKSEKMEKQEEKSADALENQPDQKPLWVVSVEERQQLAPVLEAQETDVVDIDADGFPAECWQETAEQCHQAGKQCFLMLPHIFRQEAEEYFGIYEAELRQAGFDGVVVRSLEEWGWLKAHDFLDELPMVFDAGLYGWNHLADQVLSQLGPIRLTMPVELTARELKAKGCAGQEILIYGNLPMMVSAQCMQKTTGGCTRKRGVLYLKDRTGKQMPVKNHCTFCYNTIYNASPLSLLGLEDLVRGLKPSALRLQFTTESPRETARCLKAFADGFLYGRKAEMPFAEFTRGHIKRGTE